MIITHEVKDLIDLIEKIIKIPSVENLDPLFSNLISLLHKNCLAVRERYVDTQTRCFNLSAYPIDSDGYAQSFDPITQEKEFFSAWQKYGVIVGKNIASDTQCNNVVNLMHEALSALSSNHFDIHKPNTYTHIPRDESGVEIFSRGFFEIYHDAALAPIRQNIRAYIHHVLIWGRADLWTSFDRLGLKLPRHEGAKGLRLHVDQNPDINPHFKTIQGVLALVDCPVERGTFCAVPGSKYLFDGYKNNPEKSPEFVELGSHHPHEKELRNHAQALPLRAGDMVSWDSRTTHANTDNISNDPRYVFYIAAGVANEENEAAVKARRDAFTNGLATSPYKVPESLLRASLKPRYTNPKALASLRKPETLTLLGELLYGEKQYKDIIPPPAP